MSDQRKQGLRIATLKGLDCANARLQEHQILCSFCKLKDRSWWCMRGKSLLVALNGTQHVGQLAERIQQLREKVQGLRDHKQGRSSGEQRGIDRCADAVLAAIEELLGSTGAAKDGEAT
jgi:hypothetical protein